MAAGVTRTRSARSRFRKPESCRACASRWPSNKNRTVSSSAERSAGGIGTCCFVQERDLEFGQGGRLGQPDRRRDGELGGGVLGAPNGNGRPPARDPLSVGFDRSGKVDRPEAVARVA